MKAIWLRCKQDQGRERLCTKELGISRRSPHDKAKMHCDALIRGKNLALSKDTCAEKEMVPLKVTQRKIESGTEAESAVG